MLQQRIYADCAMHAGARFAADRALSARSPAAVHNMGNFNGVFDDRLIGEPTMLSRLAGAGYRIGYAGN